MFFRIRGLPIQALARPHVLWQLTVPHLRLDDLACSSSFIPFLINVYSCSLFQYSPEPHSESFGNHIHGQLLPIPHPYFFLCTPNKNDTGFFCRSSVAYTILRNVSLTSVHSQYLLQRILYTFLFQAISSSIISWYKSIP